MTNLKRVNFVIGFDQQGKPMSLGFSATEFRQMYFSDDGQYVYMVNTKPDSTEKITVVYPVDKYYAIEYQEADPVPVTWGATFKMPENLKSRLADGLDVA